MSLTVEERYGDQASSSSAAPAAGGGGGGRLYLDAYEVSFPLEESIERPPSYQLNQGQQMIDGTPRARHMTTGYHHYPGVESRIFWIVAASICEEVLVKNAHGKYL